MDVEQYLHLFSFINLRERKITSSGVEMWKTFSWIFKNFEGLKKKRKEYILKHNKIAPLYPN